MTYKVTKSEGVIVETEDGSFVWPSSDMAYPDVDELEKLVGTKRKVSFNGEYTRIERVDRVKGWFGYIEGQHEWYFDRAKATLEKVLKVEDEAWRAGGFDDDGDDIEDEFDDMDEDDDFDDGADEYDDADDEDDD